MKRLLIWALKDKQRFFHEQERKTITAAGSRDEPPHSISFSPDPLSLQVPHKPTHTKTLWLIEASWVYPAQAFFKFIF